MRNLSCINEFIIFYNLINGNFHTGGQYTVVKSLEDIEMLKVNMYGINMKLDPAIKKSTALNNIF